MKIKENQIIGAIFAIMNILWTIDTVCLFYKYHFTDIMFLFMYPDWVLIVNMIIGIIGLYMSIILFINRLKNEKIIYHRDSSIYNRIFN